MSWSINLHGPREVVQREVADAILLLDKALDYVLESDSSTMSVSVGGYVSWNENNEITASNVSFSVGEDYYVVKPESSADVANQAKRDI